MGAAPTSAVSSETPREKCWCSKLTRNSSLFLISSGYESVAVRLTKYNVQRYIGHTTDQSNWSGRFSLEFVTPASESLSVLLWPPGSCLTTMKGVGAAHMLLKKKRKTIILPVILASTMQGGVAVQIDRTKLCLISVRTWLIVYCGKTGRPSQNF